MFTTLLKIETRKLFKRKLLWIELALICGLIVLSLSGLFMVRVTGIAPSGEGMLEDTVTWPRALIFPLTFMTHQTFGALLVMLLVGLVVAQEYDWGSYSLWLRQGASRRAMVGAKFAILLGSTLILVGGALIAAALPSALFTVVIKGNLNLSQLNAPQVALGVLRTAYSLLPFVALTFLIAMGTRSPVVSIGVGIGYTLLVEGLLTQILVMVVGGVPAKLAMWLPGSMAASLVQLNDAIATTATTMTPERAAMMPDYLPPQVAATGIAVYVLLFLGFALHTFVRQDLTT